MGLDSSVAPVGLGPHCLNHTVRNQIGSKSPGLSRGAACLSCAYEGVKSSQRLFERCLGKPATGKFSDAESELPFLRFSISPSYQPSRHATLCSCAAREVYVSSGVRCPSPRQREDRGRRKPRRLGRQSGGTLQRRRHGRLGCPPAEERSRIRGSVELPDHARYAHPTIALQVSGYQLRLVFQTTRLSE